MVTQHAEISTTATEAEIAAAAQEAEEARQRQAIKTGDVAEGVSQMPELRNAVKPLQYRISPADAAAWVMVWELKLDADGEVYGDPTRAPRQQLGLWLQKKREDGGARFSIDMPGRIRAEPQFPCLYQGCRKRMYTRIDMVEHVRGTHPREARMYDKMLEEIVAKAAEENPRVREIADTIIGMEDRGLVSVSVTPTPRMDRVDPTAGAPTVESLGLRKIDGCASCEWKFKESWSEAQQQQFLMAHIRGAHKEEIE